jgi:hypothetical protein
VSDPSVIQFILLAIIFATGVMILLQATVRRAVWGGYIIPFLAATIAFAGTVLLR